MITESELLRLLKKMQMGLLKQEMSPCVKAGDYLPKSARSLFSRRHHCRGEHCSAAAKNRDAKAGCCPLPIGCPHSVNIHLYTRTHTHT